MSVVAQDTKAEELVAAGWTCKEWVSRGRARAGRCGNTSAPRRVEVYRPGTGAGPFDPPRHEWMCGTHAAMHEGRARRWQQHLAEREAAQAHRAEVQKRVSYAHNVASVLSDALRVQGAPNTVFDVAPDGTDLIVDVAAAEALYRWLVAK